MPRDFMFTKEQIINAALSLTREKGFSAVSARTLGEKLGTSSRPVFGRFENMEEVKSAIIETANELYQSYRKTEIESGKYVPFKASGMAYIRFAREEKELFKLLFMRDRSKEGLKSYADEMDELVSLVGKQVDLDKDKATMFYLEMWIYVHGIASMIATNYLEWDEEIASRAVTDVYEGLKLRYGEKEGEKND